MQKLLIFTPAVVLQANHAAMIAAQARQHEFLRRAFEDAGILTTTAIVYDALEEQFWPRLANVPTTYRISPCQVERYRSGGRSGIRRPVDYLIDTVPSWQPTENLALLRITQDTLVTDYRRFVADALRVMRTQPGDYVAGKHQYCTDITKWVRALELHPRSCYEYVQGNVMLAPYETWRLYYRPMPAGVTHWCDDSVMSAWVQQTGGTLLFLEDTFWHFHEISVADLAGALAALQPDFGPLARRCGTSG
jgi:hypothetical protein